MNAPGPVTLKSANYPAIARRLVELALEAGERIMAQLLKEPTDFIEDTRRVFAEEKVPIEVVASGMPTVVPESPAEVGIAVVSGRSSAASESSLSDEPELQAATSARPRTSGVRITPIIAEREPPPARRAQGAGCGAAFGSQ